ncbi:MAG TPA: Fe-S cluster assembly protein SufD [Burkholderiales bacterium]|nr:Fe-S cluster assembly protein SufD [Burkholderiales bacterium]
MSTVAAVHPYIEALLKGYELPRSGISWLNERRARALERANALTVPTTRDEEWRFTDLTPLTRVPFQPAAGAPQPAMAEVSRFIAPEATAHLVFVNGVFAPELSANAGLPYGVLVTPLAAALATHAAVIEPHLARIAPFDNQVFAALNTAQLHDGAFVWIARNQRCPTPVQLLYLSTQRQSASYPRCLVVVESGAECTLIEDYAGLDEGPYFANAVTEIALGEGARLAHVRLQREAKGAFHIATCAVSAARDAHYALHAVTLGARLSRFDLEVAQRGEGVEARLDGLALISGRQLADTHSLMDHAAPRGRCRQLHKCIVGGAAHAVFNGKIVVRSGAQLTDSAQQSRNLLLSDKAHVDAKPQLEIFADDVKCSHGATVGQLDAEQLFYLLSRGLAPERARNLLVYAFGAEVIDRIPVPSLVEQLERAVLEETETCASSLPREGGQGDSSSSSKD